MNEKNIRDGSVLGAAMLIYNLVLIRLLPGESTGIL